MDTHVVAIVTDDRGLARERVVVLVVGRADVHRLQQRHFRRLASTVCRAGHRHCDDWSKRKLFIFLTFYILIVIILACIN